MVLHMTSPCRIDDDLPTTAWRPMRWTDRTLVVRAVRGIGSGRRRSPPFPAFPAVPLASSTAAEAGHEGLPSVLLTGCRRRTSSCMARRPRAADDERDHLGDVVRSDLDLAVKLLHALPAEFQNSGQSLTSGD